MSDDKRSGNPRKPTEVKTPTVTEASIPGAKAETFYTTYSRTGKRKRVKRK